MFRVCYANVSDIAVCQRCPALFGYKIHMQEKDAWLEGIKGKGDYYGSMFHKNIAQVFFEAASDSKNTLHVPLGRAVSGGRETLEEFVRENIFMPFVERCSGWYTPGQIMAAAEGVRVWVKAMHEFFREIPSLMIAPLRNMHAVFHAPEQKLQSSCDFPGEGKLVVTGCYDALMFNPDRAEARLFEFKGYSKSDAVVPLSQSVMYAWLIERLSGIVPSVEIIYLDEEDRKPDIFSPESVRGMIKSGLPGLFYAAFNTIRLRRLPRIMKDKDFCGECRFRNDCMSDWGAKFGKRKGASLVNVMVFMMASVMIISHAFFFSNLSSENMALQAETLQRNFRYNMALSSAIEIISDDNFKYNTVSPEVVSYTDFSKDYTSTPSVVHPSGPRLRHYSSGDIYMSIHDLYYSLHGFNTSSYASQIQRVDSYSTAASAKAIMPFRVFPPMLPESGDTHTRYFLVRVYGTEKTYGERANSGGKRELMHQVLVRRDSSKQGSERAKVLTFQEVWY
ncbi:MAG: hypothetical protein IJS28_04395 [Synergistaceae bacterium]|nr:hypothetical protein [Synergistaceae bacterium]